MSTGVDNIGRGKAEGINRSVGHSDGPGKCRIDGRLYATGFFGRDNIRTDASACAGLYKSFLIAEIILGQCDKETVGLVHTMGGNLAERHVLLDTFRGRLTVGHRIACTAMKQSMIATRSTVGEIVFLHLQHLQASHGAVACRTGSRDATTDDDYIIFFKLIHPYQVFRLLFVFTLFRLRSSFDSVAYRFRIQLYSFVCKYNFLS